MCCRDALSDHIDFLLSYDVTVLKDSHALVAAAESLFSKFPMQHARVYKIMRSFALSGVDVNCVNGDDVLQFLSL